MGVRTVRFSGLLNAQGWGDSLGSLARFEPALSFAEQHVGT
jgi:hypothetical protein